MQSLPSERRIKVVLHGALKKLYDKPIELMGATPADIINGLCRMTKAFNPKPGVERHILQVLGYDSEASLHSPLKPDSAELHLMPAMLGGKSGGFFRIVIGVVLIAASFFLPAGPLIAGFSFSLSSIAFNFGLSLVLGGLLEMLSPQPKADTTAGVKDPEASKYLGATANTVKIGTRIPIVYGEILCYGHYISFDVDAKDVVVT